MTLSGTDLQVGTRDPIKTKPPIPTAARIMAILAGIVASLMAGLLTYKLGFNPEHVPDEHFRDLVVLASVLWVVTAALLSIGTREPKIPDPPTPTQRAKGDG